MACSVGCRVDDTALSYFPHASLATMVLGRQVTLSKSVHETLDRKSCMNKSALHACRIEKCCYPCFGPPKTSYAYSIMLLTLMLELTIVLLFCAGLVYCLVVQLQKTQQFPEARRKKPQT